MSAKELLEEVQKLSDEEQEIFLQSIDDLRQMLVTKQRIAKFEAFLFDLEAGRGSTPVGVWGNDAANTIRKMRDEEWE